MMLVRNWMKRPIRSVKPLDTAKHARALLEEHRINQLPVLVDGELVGIITDRDLRDAFPSVFEAAAASRDHRKILDPERVTVESVMSHEVAVIGPDEPITHAARAMREQRIGALPVVEKGKVVAILTRSDLLDALVTFATDSEPIR